MPSNWLAFDRIRALAKTYRLYPAERVYQDQPHLDKITAGGEFLDFNQQSTILDQTNLQINRLERYKDYEQMDQTGEVNLALDLYADEASLVDPERKHTLIIRARSRRLKKELEDLFFNVLRWDTYCRPTVRYLCKYGDSPFEIILDADRSSVMSIKFMNVYNFTRIETRYGDLIGFFYMDAMWPRPQFLHPWQVMHLRLTSFENLYMPYGRSILDGGRKSFKQLRLMEDAALIYRITRSAEKRKFSIPVGNIPPKEIPEYMQMIARTFKRQRFYNPSTSTFDERYSPLIQEDDFFLPRRPDGTGPEVDVLPGAQNLDQIADIEYFKKKMIAPMKIPFARVGIGSGSGGASEKSLSQSHSEFAKAVQWVQREVATGLTKIALVHLALRGYRAEDLRGFEIALTATSAMEELYRIETWQTRTAVMQGLKDLSWFPKEWIVTHFTDLSPDEIQELKDMEDVANSVPGEGGGGGGAGGGGGLDVLATDTGGDDMANDAAQADISSGPIELTGEEGETPPTPAIEGFDLEAERRLITELKRDSDGAKSKRMKTLVESVYQRLGKAEKSPIELNSGFDHLLSTKELDGLSTKTPTSKEIMVSEGKIDVGDPNKDGEDVIFKWSVDDAERQEALISNYNLLIREQVELPEDNEVTDADMIVVSNL